MGSGDGAKPMVTVRTRLEKFDGDVPPGTAPVEVIERVETMPMDKFVAMFGLGGGADV